MVHGYTDEGTDGIFAAVIVVFAVTLLLTGLVTARLIHNSQPRTSLASLQRRFISGGSANERRQNCLCTLLDRRTTNQRIELGSMTTGLEAPKARSHTRYKVVVQTTS